MQCKEIIPIIGAGHQLVNCQSDDAQFRNDHYKKAAHDGFQNRYETAAKKQIKIPVFSMPGLRL